MKKKMLESKRGITLISLIVIIVMLLSLVGVSIVIYINWESNIIKQEQEENTEDTEVNENMEITINKNNVTDNEIENEKQEVAEEKTIGYIYTEELVGKTINYTSETELPEGTEWIILGEDEDGNIMLTTSKPIENGITLNGTAEEWISYEEDIKEACSIYGATVQGQEVKARSITLKDVNRVTGFVEPKFNTYTFGRILNFAAKKVDYYHPDAKSENFWSKKEKKYKNNGYMYYIDSTDNLPKYAYEGTEWKKVNYTTTLKNMDIILGKSLDYVYLLGSRSIIVNSSRAYFNVAAINEGCVRGDKCLGYSDSDHFYYSDKSVVSSIRPIIELPSNIQVEERNGELKIAD